ncbi:3'-5' exonuclease [Friedmanniomyces endolithicus]|uniref:RNA exonuclease 4 n=1 Tax=Friedmanniomyces endolithicus TaxID=329885 RepID=A0AAN6FLS8_9PEZI|nr:3'-5' exonuclease [Friedmanniomyces endolithicus]KAK0283135.1 3'-5' exonuclease [Friedmanniomyces endolithicus]KAK0311158.1 3'-5' exonuclease [Friedmanniomyces endolithicus]KAK0320109.1 3'-5' exonuclease [Friedmanniomyces endolithicus]KAK0825873.1 3'-5' exonuclease [Friedmanniomyces endolithicus]
MSKLDIAQVSSNWKKLQVRLKAEKKPEAQENGVKRKRSEETQKTVSGYKKAKIADRRPEKRKMGTGGSKPAETEQPTRVRAKLIKEHGIAPGDVSMAYSAFNSTAKRDDDEINGGLHPSHKAGKYVALDCEMVGTGPPPYADNVLARASLVNFHGEQIYDSYALPPPGIKVEDYRTHVSGIKPHHMKPGVARSFAEVQTDVAELLAGRILVGHALKNDLQVLLLSHPKRDLRDTSRYAKFRVESMGKTPALRNLAKKELGMIVQSGEHSSVEDARAAVLLYKKEKVGFEEENRRYFGVSHRRNDKKAGKKQSLPDAADESDDGGEDEGDEEADLELLAEDEDDGTGEANGQQTAASLGAKKKRKKKKRTKRK